MMKSTHFVRPVFVLCALGTLITFASPSAASAWDPFRSRNSNVQVGNARVAAGDHAGAVPAYERAARELPERTEVQLNQGIALLGTGDLPAAREALVEATNPNSSDDVRADAYYDLGLAFYREGDASAQEEDHQTAQQQFREAVDAYRRSLRLRPRDRNTAWNLELALRRLRESEEQQEQQQEQEQNQEGEEGDEQNQDGQEGQDGEQEGQEGQDGEQEGQEGQDGEQEGQEGQDGEQEGQEGQDGEQEGQEGQDGEQQGQEGQDGEEQQEGGQPGDEGQSDGQDGSQEADNADGESQEGEQQGEQQSGEGSSSSGSDFEPTENGGGGQRLPGHVQRVLDALESDEQNLERVRARQRARTEGRRVNRDW